MIRINFTLFCLIWVLGQPSPGYSETVGEASKVIETLNSALLETMKEAEILGYQGRYKKLSNVIDSTHNLEYIARFSIGKKNWEKLNDDQKNNFIDGFKKYSIAAYASQFDGFSGEVFRVEGEKPGKRSSTQVDSLLEIPGEETVDFVYILRPEDGEYKIVNIIVKGVSDLALKRAEFKSLITENGFDALLSHLKDKTDAYAANTK